MPDCPAGSQWDEGSSACVLPCSSMNTANITYTASPQNPKKCVPACPAGHTARPTRGREGSDAVACVRCGPSGVVTAGKKGSWVCRRGSQTTMPVSSVVLPVVDRAVAQGGCADGATVVNGVCAACQSCDAYTPANATLPAYQFYQNDGQIFCVPQGCCLEESWTVEEGEGGEAGR